MDRPLRTLFFFLIILTLGLAVDPPAESAPPAAEPAATEPLFYTIQIGSFSNEEEANTWYDRLAEELPSDLKQHLRIESIPPFLTVRVGKAETRQDIIVLLEEAQKITKTPPAILHGYYKTERILKVYDQSLPPKEATATPKTKSASPPESLSPKVGTTASLSQERPEESLDATASAKGPIRPKPRTASAKAAPPEPPKSQIPDATMKQMIIDKYLAAKSSDPKAKEALIKKSQTYPTSPACVTADCHAAVKSLKNSHYPAQTERCSACHTQISQKHPDAGTADFKLAATGAALCNACHPKLQGKKYSHEPAATGECLECHAPHGSDSPFFLTMEADSQEKLCLKCHAEQVTATKFTHGPVGLGACTYCHNPHESDHDALLKDDPQTLCYECHTDVAQGIKESTSVHRVVATEGCATCHLPHGSEFPKLLKMKGEDFCFTCHQDIEDKYKKSRSKHAGIFLDKECGTCHQPHFSRYEKLLNNKELDLCLTCHSEKNTITAKAPKNIANDLKLTFLHEPLSKGQCSVCHDPHGSKFVKLLSGPYPESIYANYEPEIYDFCFNCHDKELLTNQTTESSTSFRNGTQNLHYLHAAIPRKGRTCRTCHQAHSSNGPKLINQTGSSFGEWQMSISFSTTGAGGSCMPGCHRKMEYNREKELSNAVKDSDYGTYHVEYESLK